MKEFSESSKLFKPFYLATVLPIMGIMSFLLLEQIEKHDNVGIIASSLAIVLNGCTALFLYSLKLDVKMDEQGIGFRYKPFQRSFTTYPWNDLSTVEVVKINPIRDFGGWGKRRNGRLGVAYLSKGDKALKMTDSANKSIFVSVIDEKAVNSTLANVWKAVAPAS